MCVDAAAYEFLELKEKNLIQIKKQKKNNAWLMNKTINTRAKQQMIKEKNGKIKQFKKKL